MVETLDRLANIGGLVKKRVKVNARRNAPKVGNGLPYGVDHGHRVGARLLVDGKVDGILAVDAHHVGLGFGRVLHAGNVLDEDRHGPAIGSRLGRDRNISQDIHQVVADLRIREKIVVLAPDLDVPGRQDQVGEVDGIDDLDHRKIAGKEFPGIHVDVDLADLAAVDRRLGDVGQLLKLGLDRVVGQIIELDLVHLRIRDGQGDNGNVGDVELQDEGLLDAGGKLVLNL